MKEKILAAMNEIDEAYIGEAAASKKKRTPWLRWTGAIAAVLALVLVAGSLIPADAPPVQTGSPGTTQSDTERNHPGVVRINLEPMYVPVYPQMPAYSLENWDAWQAGLKAQYDQPEGYADSLDAFLKTSIPQFLWDTGDKNQLYSPLNVYMALAMLAETSDGNSRQQILDLLGVDSLEALRTQTGHVWNAQYRDDGMATSLLASSVWLDAEVIYHADTAKTLAEYYYASFYSGTLGSEEMNQALRDWLNDNTGGLLQEQAAGYKLDPETVFALATTLYYKVGWRDSFRAELNTQAPFHSPQGDVQAVFMHCSLDGAVYETGNGYTMTRLPLDDGGYMWLVLPEAGKTIQDVLAQGHALESILAGDPDVRQLTLQLSMPKFDVVSDMDLAAGIQQLGVTDVFSPDQADFSALIPESSGLYVNKIQHAVRVVADEEGVEAAAYTIIDVPRNAAPPDTVVELTLDRPFLFVITSHDGLPLFVGTVNQP